METDQRTRRRACSVSGCHRSVSNVAAHRKHREHAKNASGDESALDDARRHESMGQGVVTTFEDRQERQCGSHVGDDQEHLEKHASGDPCVFTGSDDIRAGVVQDWRVEDEQRRNGRGKGGEPEQTTDQ